VQRSRAHGKPLLHCREHELHSSPRMAVTPVVVDAIELGEHSGCP
jgi:hypothetical protein